MSKYKLHVKDQGDKTFVIYHTEEQSSNHVALYEAKMLFLDGYVSEEYTIVVEDDDGTVLYTVTYEGGVVRVTLDPLGDLRVDRRWAIIDGVRCGYKG